MIRITRMLLDMALHTLLKVALGMALDIGTGVGKHGDLGIGTEEYLFPPVAQFKRGG